jgi:hypothetical protein
MGFPLLVFRLPPATGAYALDFNLDTLHTAAAGSVGRDFPPSAVPGQIFNPAAGTAEKMAVGLETGIEAGLVPVRRQLLHPSLALQDIKITVYRPQRKFWKLPAQNLKQGRRGWMGRGLLQILQQRLPLQALAVR